MPKLAPTLTFLLVDRTPCVGGGQTAVRMQKINRDDAHGIQNLLENWRNYQGFATMFIDPLDQSEEVE